jgi:uracil-DNA glycosylase
MNAGREVDPNYAEDAPARSLAAARRQAAACVRCPLFRSGSQTVFGEGPLKARVMLVGEKPGDREDIEGKPFVGPAGRLLNEALDEAGIERDDVYITNAVKHFKFEQRGKRRLHKKPNAAEIDRCRWWLDLELEFVAPAAVGGLGATALRGLTGKQVSITSLRGKPGFLDSGTPLIATIHPSFLLRIREHDPDWRRERERFVADLALARQFLDDAPRRQAAASGDR